MSDESAQVQVGNPDAKFALVRQVPVDAAHQRGASRWVFLMGSRNLTKDVSISDQCWKQPIRTCQQVTSANLLRASLPCWRAWSQNHF